MRVKLNAKNKKFLTIVAGTVVFLILAFSSTTERLAIRERFLSVRNYTKVHVFTGCITDQEILLANDQDQKDFEHWKTVCASLDYPENTECLQENANFNNGHLAELRNREFEDYEQIREVWLFGKLVSSKILDADYTHQNDENCIRKGVRFE